MCFVVSYTNYYQTQSEWYNSIMKYIGTYKVIKRTYLNLKK